MKYRVLLLCFGVLGISAQAQALGNLRAAIGSGGFELDDGDLDVDADLSSADFRAALQVNEHVFLRGQYTRYSANKIEIDGDKYDADMDLDTVRLGAGYGGDVGSIRLYGAAEYVSLDFEIEGESDDGNGWGVTLGIGDQNKSKLMWNAELTFLDVDGTGGASLDASIGYRITPVFAGLIGVQSYALEDDDSELSFGSAYLGLQLSF
ncbi:MAG: outer membrane protein beta-barrel protein [Hydrocarboniphaga sp.]|nr:outer membrane protein beta-barrel protein [Hydrocarboniphaga sp.]